MDGFHGMRCQACGASPCDPAHIKSRGSGGHDIPDNIMALCRQHHTECHKIGWGTMARRYPGVAMDLELKGWVMDPFGKLRHDG